VNLGLTEQREPDRTEAIRLWELAATWPGLLRVDEGEHANSAGEIQTRHAFDAERL
jgi:hypothetical protein